MIREVSELAIARYDISDRIDMLHIRTSIAIRDDTSFIRDNLCFLECEVAHIRYATECEQDMRVWDPVTSLRKEGVRVSGREDWCT